MTAPVRRGDYWFRVNSGPLVVADTPPAPAGARRPRRRLAGLVLPLALRHPRRLRALVRGRRAERAPRDRDGDGRGAPDRIPFTSNATVAWFPDESGFAVNAGTAPDFERVDKVLLVHRLGRRSPSLPEPIEVREPYCVYPQVSADGRFLVAITSEVEPRADWIRRAPGR